MAMKSEAEDMFCLILSSKGQEMVQLDKEDGKEDTLEKYQLTEKQQFLQIPMRKKRILMILKKLQMVLLMIQ